MGGLLLDQTQILEVGRVYICASGDWKNDVVLAGVVDHYDARRFELVGPSPTDMEQLKALLTKAGTEFVSWRIYQYVDKNTRQPVHGFDGWCLTHGAADWDGPYVEYIFDKNGYFVPNSSGLWYQEEGKTLVA
jgi:hypothetical protein